MPKLFQICLYAFFAMEVGQSYAQLAAMPVHSTPRWQVVAGLPEAPGASIAVASLATNQVIGEIKPNEKLLSFGSDGKVVTFAYNGVIGYVPLSAVRELYPVEVKTVQYKTWGPTLEQQAEAEKLAQKDINNRSLAPLVKKGIDPAVAPAGAPLGPGGNVNMGGNANLGGNIL